MTSMDVSIVPMISAQVRAIILPGVEVMAERLTAIHTTQHLQLREEVLNEMIVVLIVQLVSLIQGILAMIHMHLLAASMLHIKLHTRVHLTRHVIGRMARWHLRLHRTCTQIEQQLRLLLHSRIPGLLQLHLQLQPHLHQFRFLRPKIDRT